jgi:hypothetical protein
MRVWRRWLLLLAASMAAGCLSPTLPLPPPSDPEVSGPTEQGLVRLQGTVPANSWVFALNHNTDLAFAQGTHENGVYDFEIKAQVGDDISLWYERSGDASESLDFTIEQPKQ